MAVELAPCDLLFVHRDAEGAEPDVRRDEIAAAARESGMDSTIPVVPVRMTEAWLLWNEAAIRRAAGNPRGRGPLELPTPREVERRSDPKADLFVALRAASGLGARRRAKVATEVRLVADAIEDYAPLRAAAAFARLEADVEHVVRSRAW